MSEYPVKSRQAIDVDEFERRLRGNEPVQDNDTDPLAELARLVEPASEATTARQSTRRAAEPNLFLVPPPPPLTQPEPAAWSPAVAPPAKPASEAKPATEWDEDLRGWEEELRGMVANGELSPVLRKPAAPVEPPAAAPEAYASEPAISAHSYHEDMRDDFAPGPGDFEPDHAAPAQPHAGPEHHDGFTRAAEPAYDAPRDLDEERGNWRNTENYDGSEQRYAEGGVHDGLEAEQPATRSVRKPLIWVGVASLAVVGLVGGAFALRGGIGGKKDAPTILAAAGPAKIQPEKQASATDANPTASVFDKKNDKIGASRVVSNEEQPVDLAAQAKARAAAINSAAPATAGGNSFFPEPKRVKTVSVRPDGSIIEGDAQPAARAPVAPAASTPSAPPKPAAVAVAVATPPSAATPKPAVPKATVRVATTPRIDAADGDGATAAKPKPPAPKPTTTASVDTRPAAGGGGGYSVQFAAAGSDAEARDRIAKVQSQFGSALGGHRPSVVKGEANGKPVFRVRVAGVSKADAVTMCTQVKESGGTCFVAGN